MTVPEKPVVKFDSTLRLQYVIALYLISIVTNNNYLILYAQFHKEFNKNNTFGIAHIKQEIDTITSRCILRR